MTGDLRQFLIDLFKKAGVELAPVMMQDATKSPLVVGRLSTGSFWVKSDEHVCNISVAVAPFPPSKDPIGLLKLNFKYPFGRISVLELPKEGGLFVVCETMFFIREDDSLVQELEDRLKSLSAIKAAAKTFLDSDPS